MSASSCRLDSAATAESSPSSARAASPALLPMSSAIFASIVWAAMMRQAVTGSTCPMRCTRSMACVCSALVQLSSASTTLEAACRLIPTPAAVSEATTTATSGSLLNASTCAWRNAAVWSPRIDTVLSPRFARVCSAMSITSMCFAKKTTLPTERASCAV